MGQVSAVENKNDFGYKDNILQTLHMRLYKYLF